MTSPEAITAEILRQTALRGPEKSICPSEVARALAPEEDAWRRLMGPIRAAAIRLARAGQVEVLRKGKPVGTDTAIRGVIRLRAPQAGSGAAAGFNDGPAASRDETDPKA
ncbi:DUF3253 domain-containing protein [Roseomonas frigidaquae]|uniref:DUF3253 domain-containing protein n=1 Tax=Falsiroseomonas frigidaquae TaxID=487318 RepID=A0ABX1F6B3_9PROT|nr:DUF3253 domain-containing protein [Falsiroseomonas frigidaquae]NKE47908.1 DUF3253 domain-containing protein [Falsiroseomonas frigidaquae]